MSCSDRSWFAMQIPKTMPVGWKGLFKRMARTNASPVPLRPVRSSASLTIKPVLATSRPDPKQILQRLEMSPDKAAHARSVAEQAVSSVDSMLQERKRSNLQAQGANPLKHAPAPTPPVSHALSPPPHSGVSYASPPSVGISQAGLHTSAAVVTLVSTEPPALSASQATMRTSEAVVTVMPSDLAYSPQVAVGGFPVAGRTPRSRTPSHLGSLAQIRESSEACSHEANSRITHESVAASKAEDDVDSHLRASWASRVSGGGGGCHTPPVLCAEQADSDSMGTGGIEVEEIQLGAGASR